MTKKQEELAEKHGTPEQFEKAIWRGQWKQPRRRGIQ
jgi:hypothetical protein